MTCPRARRETPRPEFVGSIGHPLLPLAENVGGGLGRPDAIGDSDPIEGIAGQDQPRMLGGLVVNRLHPVEMAERVLGHRARVTTDLE